MSFCGGSHEVLSWALWQKRQLPIQSIRFTLAAASTWEISIKRSIGKLEAPSDMNTIIEEEGFTPLSISPYHGDQAGLSLPYTPLTKLGYSRSSITNTATLITTGKVQT